MTSKFFTAKKIAPQSFAITGLCNELCYLVEGKTNALLIDSLFGIGNLHSFCRELTDLPIILANTHGHSDHVGGNFDFDECYIHPNDIALMYQMKENRIENLRNNIKRAGNHQILLESDFSVYKPMKTLPLCNNFVFDLGERNIEVIFVPGHTAGTVVLLDRSNKIVFSGDACNVNTLLNLPNSTSIEDYRESLLYFKQFQPDFTEMWGGHGLRSFPKGIIDEAIVLCDEILSGTDDAVASECFGKPCFYAKKKDDHYNRLDGKTANIAYTKEKIRKSN
jgi:glyoxylase-like metal-dependent hydrolase (beta-lactamase superfamily II)